MDTCPLESRAWSGKDTPEYKSVKENLCDITDALQCNQPASKKLKQKFKEEGWLESYGELKDDEISTLVLNRIKSNVSQFEVFISMLKDIAGMDLVVSKLNGMILCVLSLSLFSHISLCAPTHTIEGHGRVGCILDKNTAHRDPQNGRKLQ